jgi:hypothetical protein
MASRGETEGITKHIVAASQASANEASLSGFTPR